MVMKRFGWFDALVSRRRGAAGIAGGMGARGFGGGRGGGPSSATLPEGVTAELDLSYGPSAAQRLDVYRPSGATDAALLFIVHGGGWRRGDKGAARVIDNKVAHWAGRGLVVVSANYRTLPDADPLGQADDVACAIAFVQAHAAAWGADAARLVLMGHSAGAHLVSLLTADPTLARQLGAAPWLGAIALDSGAFDIERIMSRPHLALYDQAFGADPAFWRRASPTWRLQQRPVSPMLVVCSTQRPDACQQAREFAAQARAVGGQVTVVELDLSHAEANERAGLPGRYTDEIDAFMRSVGIA